MVICESYTVITDLVFLAILEIWWRHKQKLRAYLFVSPKIESLQLFEAYLKTIFLITRELL